MFLPNHGVQLKARRAMQNGQRILHHLFTLHLSTSLIGKRKKEKKFSPPPSPLHLRAPPWALTTHPHMLPLTHTHTRHRPRRLVLDRPFDLQATRLRHQAKIRGSRKGGGNELFTARNSARVCWSCSCPVPLNQRPGLPSFFFGWCRGSCSCC